MIIARLYPYFLTILCAAHLGGQTQLEPFIGLSSMPKDRDRVSFKTMMQYAPMVDFEFKDYGPIEGDTIPDFTLYSLNGSPVNMSNELLSEKAILIVSASYTCPAFRSLVPMINLIDSVYENFLTVYIIYTAEAHPTDKNPYSGGTWHNGRLWYQDNIAEDILYKQPRTYGARKAMVQEMQSEMHIHSEVLIDGPNNEWWHYFGPAPNNAYLINSDGTIYHKHPWLGNDTTDIQADIARILAPD